VKSNHVIMHYSDGRDVEMPRVEALPYAPKPIVDGDFQFIWTRNVSVKESEVFQSRLGDSIRFGEAVSPVFGHKVPGSVAVFIREDHDYQTMTADRFKAKHGWV
jgi:hypothetical protein